MNSAGSPPKPQHTRSRKAAIKYFPGQPITVHWHTSATDFSSARLIDCSVLPPGVYYSIHTHRLHAGLKILYRLD